MSKYGSHVNTFETPQSDKARSDQVENSAGGYTFKIDKWGRLDRFLILGAEGGTYYASERKLTRENAAVISECLAEDGVRTVSQIAAISHSGRAPKNDPAIFALAMAAGDTKPETRAAALEALPAVCRIGTHLFHFAADVEGFRRWGRSLRRAVASWYTTLPPDALALQAVKYQQRDGWSHRDMLRLSHPVASTPMQNSIFRWISGASPDKRDITHPKTGVTRHYKEIIGLHPLIDAFESAKRAKTWQEVVPLIRDFNLPHECVPNEMKSRPEVWEAMLPSMGLTALIRNLGKMTSVGLVTPMSSVSKLVASHLADTAALKKARIHPMAILLALTTYRAGRGVKGSLTWAPDRSVVDVLDEAFYLAFDAVTPTGKNHLLALDVSGSMESGGIAGTHLTPRVASAAMAMVTARTEVNWHCVGFTSSGSSGRWGGAPSGLTPIDISPRQRLDDVCKTVSRMSMGSTDCALPMKYALKGRVEVDTFIVYTDNETWAGAIHPHQALAKYRREMNRPAARLIVVGMTTTDFTIADPNDAGMLDVVGFDSNAPAVMADFTRGGG